jgi:hypothetical protein
MIFRKSLRESPGFLLVGVAPSNWVASELSNCFDSELPQQFMKSEHAKQLLE